MMLSNKTFDSMVEKYAGGNGLCNCMIAVAEHEQGPWTMVPNTDATMYKSAMSCMPRPVRARIRGSMTRPMVKRTTPAFCLMCCLYIFVIDHIHYYYRQYL